MSRWLDSLAQAVMALNDHRLRTFLSILGITIGIAAVIAVTTVSKGGNHIVFSELETFGLNSVWVYRDWNDDSPHAKQRAGSGIVSKDYEALRAVAHSLRIRRLTPIVRPANRGTRANNENRFANIELLGVGVDYTAIVNDTLLAGRNINRNDIERRHPVALLAPEVASKLFAPGVSPIGAHLRLDGRRFTVIGLLEGKSRDFLSSIGSSGGRSANDRVAVPYSVIQQLRGNRDINTLQLEVMAFEEAETVGQRVKSLFEHRHRQGYQYQVETMASYIDTTSRILNGVAIVGIIAASVSLLVGGMGIMNMMGTSVLERTREIGIRKALGAREQDILLQFQLEAALISVIGGTLGLLLGGLASVALAMLTGFPVVPSGLSIVGALLVSICVGLLSGILPARRAARLRPVEALRSV